MILYIGRLPAEITLAELREAFPVPRQEPWRLRLCKRFLPDGTLIRYALYHPPSEDAARRILRKGAIRIGAVNHEVREFQPRRIANERRRPGGKAAWAGPERRRQDRRASQPLISAA